MNALGNIRHSDPEIFEVIRKELGRQRHTLEMIPSENFTSLSVLEAMGSVLTNKYSEGYPGKRYYGGNEFIDVIERTAQSRAKALFGVPYANVQPYSGSPANLAVYLSVCEVGDTIMGQNLTDGGHLTHGWKTSVTGRLFNSVPYHVKTDGYIDISEVERLADAHKPKLIWIGATAYTRELPFMEFSKIAGNAGAYLAADISHIAGLVAAGAHKSPVDYADIIMTTTHKTLRGPRGAIIMVTDKGLKKDPELPEKIDRTIFPGMQGGPHDHTTAGIATALLEASTPEFRKYGEQIVKNAKALAKSLSENGIRLVTGGTDNHMVLIDLTEHGKGTGVFVQDALEFAGITVNKNTIPNDKSSPFYPSGIRLGTPAITTRGMAEGEMAEIAGLIAEVICLADGYQLPDDKDARSAYLRGFRKDMSSSIGIRKVKEQVDAMCEKFPLYPEISI
jgi:glycine hydroxymethyltransferase